MENKPDALSAPLSPSPMRRRTPSTPQTHSAPPPSSRVTLYASCLSMEGDCAVLCKWHAMELGLPDGTVLPFNSEAEFAQALITQINAHKKSVQLVTIFSGPQAPA